METLFPSRETGGPSLKAASAGKKHPDHYNAGLYLMARAFSFIGRKSSATMTAIQKAG
jgi:hypothetical protein